MSIFVEVKLTQNRKGRFLCNLLSADGFDAQSLPDAGLLMMTGEDFALCAYEARDQLVKKSILKMRLTFASEQ